MTQNTALIDSFTSCLFKLGYNDCVTLAYLITVLFCATVLVLSFFMLIRILRKKGKQKQEGENEQGR